MNKINSLEKDLPDLTHTFQLDIVGSVTKKRFLGEFTCRIPTLKDQAQIDKHNAMLNGDYPAFLNAGVHKLNKMISYLRYTLTDTPKFWRESDLGYELRDLNVVEEVYGSVIDFEEQWFKKVWDDGEVDSGSESKEV